MKKSLVVILVLVGLVFIIGSFWVSKSNEMVRLKNTAEAQWANVETAYQRRADLIGNLVKTVQGAADFERNTLKEVVEARAKATSVNIDASKLTPETVAQFQEAQSGLTSALAPIGNR